MVVRLHRTLTAKANQNMRNLDDQYGFGQKQGMVAERKRHKARGPTENRVRKPPHRVEMIFSTRQATRFCFLPKPNLAPSCAAIVALSIFARQELAQRNAVIPQQR